MYYFKIDAGSEHVHVKVLRSRVSVGECHHHALGDGVDDCDGIGVCPVAVQPGPWAGQVHDSRAHSCARAEIASSRYLFSHGSAVRLGARCLAALYPCRTPHGVQDGKSAEDVLAYF